MKKLEILPSTTVNGMGMCSSPSAIRYRSVETAGYVVAGLGSDGGRWHSTSIFHSLELAEAFAAEQKPFFVEVVVDRISMPVEFRNEADGYQAYAPSFDSIGEYLG